MTGRLQELCKEFASMGASLEESLKFAREQMNIEQDESLKQREIELQKKQSELKLQQEQKESEMKLQI